MNLPAERCVQCGASVPAEARACPACGREVPLRCPNPGCRKSIGPGMSICPFCGMVLM